MRNLRFLVVVLAALLVPAAASAQLTFGARLGYGIAGGDVVKDVKMSDGLKAQIPLQLEAGYNVTKELNVGAYFSYGFGMLNSDLKDACKAEGGKCDSASVKRLGLQGTFAFEDLSPQFVPWIGFGFGYEWTSIEETVDTGAGVIEGTATYKGFELANLQVGGDFKASPQLRFGPFVSYSFAQFGKGKLEVEGDSFETDIDDKGVHTYLTIGVRGQFGM